MHVLGCCFLVETALLDDETFFSCEPDDYVWMYACLEIGREGDQQT